MHSLCHPRSIPHRDSAVWLISAVFVLALMHIACAPGPPSKPLYIDPSEEPGYAETVAALQAKNREAQQHLAAGKRSEAAAVVKEALPLSKELLRSSRPPLEAMEAVSDLDHIYATLLLENRHIVFARQLFQNNLARWRSWKPETEETRRRLERAQEGIRRCDEVLAKQGPLPQ